MTFPSIPARHSLLSASALSLLVQNRWQFEHSLYGQLLQPAQSGGDDLYILYAHNKRYIMKVYVQGSHRLEALEAIARVLVALGKQGVAVNQPVALPDGNYTLAVQAPEGSRHVQIFAFVPGEYPGWEMTKEQARRYGGIVAQMHMIADQLPYDPSLPVWDKGSLLTKRLNIILSFLDEDSPHAHAFKQIASLLYLRLEKLSHIAPAWGFCHADCHKMNILCAEDGQTTLIDFDCAGYSWRAYELSVLLWSLSLISETGTQMYDTNLWNAYLEGYRSIQALDVQTLEAIPWFVLVRHIWWMAIDLRKIQQELSGRSWLNAKWFDRQLQKLESWRQLFNL